MKTLQRAAAALVLATGALLGSGCTTTLIVMHVVDKLTEGDPAPCHKLNSVDRALQDRCGPFVAGNLDAKDVAAPGLPICPLSLAARDPAFWPVLAELVAKGATPESCREAPWVALARENACPDFAGATRAELDALRWLAEADSRSIHHDVLRVLSCPNARRAGLDRVLDDWVAQEQLPTRGLPFGPLGALHPSHLHSPLALLLEARGHTAAAGLGAHQGALPSGFELALHDGDFDALGWWLQRVPTLANRVPPGNGNQLAWVPLARVLTPAFMPDEALRRDMVEFLLAHGANPWRTLPHEPGLTVVGLAHRLKSPMAATLEAPRAVAGRGATPVAAAAAATVALRPR